ncbi:LOW QUALITY PROTEIN: DUF4283 domain-containing protein/zf-CCHC_4 domain-containing protein, partial [Cephalotus follicularis]
MKTLWRVKYGLKIREEGSNLFLLMLNHDDVKVLKVGPWHFYKHILLSEKLEEEKHPSTISLYKAAFIRVFGIHYLCLSKRVRIIIGESIDKYLNKNNQHLKLRVSIDVRRPLWRGMKFSMGLSEKIWLSFQYERLPNFCHLCGRTGHTIKEC